MICIQGSLDASWSIDFGDVTVVPASESGPQPVTIITGEFVDQAALFGLLSRLYGLGFPLISVEYLDHYLSADERMRIAMERQQGGF
jgi:hypothetical protein